MKVMLTGGAGYIGSVTAQELAKKGYGVVIYDSLIQGKKESVSGLDLIIGETQDYNLLLNTIKEKSIEAIIHFAGFIEAGESTKDPYKYFYNNVFGSLQLIKAMTEANIMRMVFSSTAGVYEGAEQTLISESAPTAPKSPYGVSKKMVEEILEWYDKIYSLKSISLRYFNAAGASLDGTLGENHQPETHLIPNLIKAGLTGRQVVINGEDYPTPDRTCIRDYIHVVDLAQAHILALQALERGGQSNIYNVGTEKGYSNKEVAAAVEKVLGKPLNVVFGPRRTGDAAVLVADNKKIKRELGWQPLYSDLPTIIQSAVKYHQKTT